MRESGSCGYTYTEWMQLEAVYSCLERCSREDDSVYGAICSVGQYVLLGLNIITFLLSWSVNAPIVMICFKCTNCQLLPLSCCNLFRVDKAATNCLQILKIMLFPVLAAEFISKVYSIYVTTETRCFVVKLP